MLSFRKRTHQLTQPAFELTHKRRYALLLWGGLGGVVCAVLGAALFYFLAPEAKSKRQLIEARRQVKTLNKTLAESQLRVRMTEAKAAELEQQIDILNQRIREMQDTLAFYRKAQESKR